MEILILPLLQVIGFALSIYLYGLIVFGILTLLESFKIVDTYNQTIYKIHSTLFSLYEPGLAYLRPYVTIGNVDLSMPALYLALYFIRLVLEQLVNTF